MKKYTLSELLSIIIAIPVVIIFLSFYFAWCFLFYVAVAIRTGSTTRALQSLEWYVQRGELKFTWK